MYETARLSIEVEKGGRNGEDRQLDQESNRATVSVCSYPSQGQLSRNAAVEAVFFGRLEKR